MDCKFFDSHIHLNSNRVFDWENEKDWVFNNVSTTLDDFYVALNQSKKHKNVYVTAGIHPLEISNHILEEVIGIFDKEISTNPKIIAVGETGLDFYRSDKELLEDKQKRWLFAHFELAKRNKLPLVLHVRNAHEEMIDFLDSLPEWKGVIHCYEGTKETAEKYLNLRGKWMLSVSPLIFRLTSDFRDFIHSIPIDRLLVETDAPYLSDNFQMISRIIEFISEEKKIDFLECKKILWENFCNFFKLK